MNINLTIRRALGHQDFRNTEEYTMAKSHPLFWLQQESVWPHTEHGSGHSRVEGEIKCRCFNTPPQQKVRLRPSIKTEIEIGFR